MLEHVGQFLGITVGQDLQGQGMQKGEEEHQRDYKQKKEESHMWRHVRDDHNENLDIPFEILQRKK